MTTATDHGAIVAGAMGSATAIKAAPIFRWAGGKGRLVRELLSHLPPGFDRYLEPFCGGAALYFAIASRDGLTTTQWDGRATLGDLNVELIDAYAALVHDVEGVIRLLDVHAEMHGKLGREHYYQVRAMFNDEAGELDIYQRAAAFIYMNATNFNGLWRVNKSGAMNVPIGEQANPDIVKADRLRTAAAALSHAKLVACDYRTVTRTAHVGDLVYLDPPYDKTFASYTRAGFTADDQRELADEFRRLARHGVHVMASNADTELVRELYRDHHISEVSAPRSISADGDKRKRVTELIVTSYRPHVATRRGGDDATHGRWFSENCELPFTPGGAS